MIRGSFFCVTSGEKTSAGILGSRFITQKGARQLSRIINHTMAQEKSNQAFGKSKWEQWHPFIAWEPGIP